MNKKVISTGIPSFISPNQVMAFADSLSLILESEHRPFPRLSVIDRNLWNPLVIKPMEFFKAFKTERSIAEMAHSLMLNKRGFKLLYALAQSFIQLIHDVDRKEHIEPGYLRQTNPQFLMGRAAALTTLRILLGAVEGYHQQYFFLDKISKTDKEAFWSGIGYDLLYLTQLHLQTAVIFVQNNHAKAFIDALLDYEKETNFQHLVHLTRQLMDMQHDNVATQLITLYFNRLKMAGKAARITDLKQQFQNEFAEDYPEIAMFVGMQ